MSCFLLLAKSCFIPYSSFIANMFYRVYFALSRALPHSHHFILPLFAPSVLPPTPPSLSPLCTSSCSVQKNNGGCQNSHELNCCPLSRSLSFYLFRFYCIQIHVHSRTHTQACTYTHTHARTHTHFLSLSDVLSSGEVFCADRQKKSSI